MKLYQLAYALEINISQFQSTFYKSNPLQFYSRDAKSILK